MIYYVISYSLIGIAVLMGAWGLFKAVFIELPILYGAKTWKDFFRVTWIFLVIMVGLVLYGIYMGSIFGGD